MNLDQLEIESLRSALDAARADLAPYKAGYATVEQAIDTTKKGMGQEFRAMNHVELTKKKVATI